MLPGKHQGPSDPETMVMGLNKNKSAYIEWWKPLEIVKEVYLRSYADRSSEQINKNYPSSCISSLFKPEEYKYKDKLLDFMNGKCKFEEVGIEGSREKIVSLGYKLLLITEDIYVYEKWIEKTVQEIKNAKTQEEVVNLYYNWAEPDTDNERICLDCRDFRRSIADAASESNANAWRQELNGIWSNLGRECATEEFDKIIKLFDIEDTNEKETPFTGTLGDNLVMCRQDFGVHIGADVNERTALDVMAHTLHAFWMPIDRSGTLETPGLKLVGPPIPDATGFNKTLEDCMLEEAQRLWDTNRQLKVYWSGGIDSTGVLVALIRTAKGDDLDRLTVCYTDTKTNNNTVEGYFLLSRNHSAWGLPYADTSIDEYELFFNKFIDGKLNVECISPLIALEFYSKENNYVMSNNTLQHISNTARDGHLAVTGELGDQLFGSAAFGHVNDLINETSKEFLKSKQYQEYIDDIKKFNDACPISTEKLTDMLWWWNFAIKWCETRYRAALAVEDGSDLKNMLHFYDTEDFQKWSISNPDKKIKKTKQSYKWLLKDFIYDYTKDADYRDNKVKIGSLGVMIGDIAAIDDNYNIISFGKTSSNTIKMKQRYGETLSKFVRDK